jgi:hypothetical protein
MCYQLHPSGLFPVINFQHYLPEDITIAMKMKTVQPGMPIILEIRDHECPYEQILFIKPAP